MHHFKAPGLQATQRRVGKSALYRYSALLHQQWSLRLFIRPHLHFLFCFCRLERRGYAPRQRSFVHHAFVAHFCGRHDIVPDVYFELLLWRRCVGVGVGMLVQHCWTATCGSRVAARPSELQTSWVSPPTLFRSRCRTGSSMHPSCSVRLFKTSRISLTRRFLPTCLLCMSRNCVCAVCHSCAVVCCPLLADAAVGTRTLDTFAAWAALR